MTDREHKRLLTELLHEIAGADLQIDAPRGMEVRALKHWDAGATARAARIHRKPRMRVWLSAGAGALAAAMLLLIVVYRSPRGSIAVREPLAHSEVRAQPAAVQAPTAAAMFPAVASQRIAIARPEPEQGEIVSFMPLSPDARQDLLGSFQVARVLLPREVLADLGVVLDANRVGEPIQADVVFGEDGVARAIRLANQGAGRSQ